MRIQRYIVFLVGAAALLLLASCTPVKVAYFREVSGNFPGEYYEHLRVSPEIVSKTTCYRTTYDGRERPVKVEYLSFGRLTEAPHDSVAVTTFTYHPDRLEYRYFNAAGKPAAVKNRIGRKVFFLDKKGRATLEANYSLSGRPVKDVHGAYQYRLVQDDRGRVVGRAPLDKAGKRITDLNGFYDIRLTYDERGRCLEMANYGPDGKLLADKLFDVAIYRNTYGKGDEPIEIIHYGTDGRIKAGLYGITITQYKYDQNGQETEMRYLDKERRLMGVGSQKIAVIRYKYDKWGNLVKTTIYDRAGNLLRSVTHVVGEH